MAMGPDQVVVVRSEYRVGTRDCPNHGSGGQWNPNESQMSNFGCANAYNMGQMLARPRDAAVGRDAGPADATVSSAAIQRYRDGKVRTTTAGAMGGGGESGGAGTPPASPTPASPTN